MENVLTRQNFSVNENDFLIKTPNETEFKSKLKYSLVTDYVTKNGRTGQTVVMFNNIDVTFEEIQIGIQFSLYLRGGISKFKSTVYSIENGLESVLTSYDWQNVPKKNYH